VIPSVGLGWRPETAWLIDTRPIAFSEVIAENIDARRPPRALADAVERGLVVVTHGVSLSLGGGEPPARARIARLAAVARTLRSPLVSEHIAFVRAGELEGTHFLPVPRTRGQLAILVDHVRRVMDQLPVPLALENIAAPVAWPGDELEEADFVAELLERTGAQLLLDVANLHANLVNYGGDLARYLDRLPLDRIAYMHAAGGARVDAMWRDTHAHPIGPTLLDVLAKILARTGPVPILLERDHAFGTRAALDLELDALDAVLARAYAVDAGRAEPTGEVAHYCALPVVDASLRQSLTTAHRALLRTVLEPAVPPPNGFAPHQIAEARAILASRDRHAKH